MKKIITALALSAVMISSASARTDTEKAEMCEGISGLAKQVMSGRQRGVSVIDSMNLARSAGGMRTLMVEMVTKAYSAPSYSTEEFQDKEKREFGAEYYLDCMKNAK